MNKLVLTAFALSFVALLGGVRADPEPEPEPSPEPWKSYVSQCGRSGSHCYSSSDCCYNYYCKSHGYGPGHCKRSYRYKNNIL